MDLAGVLEIPAFDLGLHEISNPIADVYILSWHLRNFFCQSDQRLANLAKNLLFLLSPARRAI